MHHDLEYLEVNTIDAFHKHVLRLKLTSLRLKEQICFGHNGQASTMANHESDLTLAMKKDK